MPGPIDDYPGKGQVSSDSTKSPTGAAFADVHNSGKANSYISKKGGFSGFESFMGKENYKKWLNTFNMSVVQNIKKDREHEQKVARQMKASATGGDIWDV
jgi:hypothetical protein